MFKNLFSACLFSLALSGCATLKEVDNYMQKEYERIQAEKSMTEEHYVSESSRHESKFGSCEKFKEKSKPWTVACNSKTEDGYYWKVESKVESYGYWGLENSGNEPACNAGNIGEKAQTASWKNIKDQVGYWDVHTDWCKREANKPNQTLNPKCSSDRGRSISCNAEHCGVYSVVCTAQLSSSKVAEMHQSHIQSGKERDQRLYELEQKLKKYESKEPRKQNNNSDLEEDSDLVIHNGAGAANILSEPELMASRDKVVCLARNGTPVKLTGRSVSTPWPFEEVIVLKGECKGKKGWASKNVIVYK